MEIYHNTTNPVSFEGFLYYANMKDSIFHLVSEDPSDAFIFAPSSNITNGGITTEQLTKTDISNITEPGIIREMSGTFDVSLNDEQRKEYEFCIKPSPNVDFDQSYFFVIEDDTVKVLSSFWKYDILPKIYLQKPTLTVTANNASRSFGEDNPTFTVSYSGFIDGDDEAVLNVLPNTSCSANSSSVVGTYDIVPSGANDNKYNFTYVKGELTVNPASSISDNINSNMSIYPNPANDFIFIQGDYSGKLLARIYNLSGKCILESVIENSKIDIRNLNNGLYILNVNGAVFKISKL